MKKIINIIVLLAAVIMTYGQTAEREISVFDRSKAPDPAPAKKDRNRFI